MELLLSPLLRSNPIPLPSASLMENRSSFIRSLHFKDDTENAEERLPRRERKKISSDMKKNLILHVSSLMDHCNHRRKKKQTVGTMVVTHKYPGTNEVLYDILKSEQSVMKRCQLRKESTTNDTKQAPRHRSGAHINQRPVV